MSIYISIYNSPDKTLVANTQNLKNLTNFINKVPRVDNAQSYPNNIHKGN